MAIERNRVKLLVYDPVYEEIVKVSGRQETERNPPHVGVYARKLNACLESADRLE